MINRLYDRFHLFIGHGRVARQTQFGLRNVFGEGQMQAVPFRIASLLMRWNGVVDHRSYVFRSEIFLQFIASFAKNRIDVIHGVIGSNKLYAPLVQSFIIAFGNGFAALVVVIKIFQFYFQDGCLHFIQAAVEALIGEYIFATAAIIAERTNGHSKCFIVGGHGTCIAQSTEIFARIKAVGSGIYPR